MLTHCRGLKKGNAGCYLTHLENLKTIQTLGKDAFIMEDDVAFCQDFHERMDLVQAFCNTHPWDVFWLGATFHPDHYWHTAKGHLDLGCKCILNRDWEYTDCIRVLRTYGCWDSYAFLVNASSTGKLVELMEKYAPEAYAIDHLFIHLQPEILSYTFVPGIAKQIDDLSDVGMGKNMSKFSGFARLGPHWFQEKMASFNPATMKKWSR